MKAEKNTILEQQLPHMQVTVAERGHIYEAIGNKTKISAVIKHIRKRVFRASPN